MIIPKTPNFLSVRYNADSAEFLDEFGNRYSFDVYHIDHRPSGLNDVYAFCLDNFAGYTPVYIGQAKRLPNRLIGHEKLDEAKALGASKVLICSPSLGPLQSLDSVEERLIKIFTPKLNVQHNRLAGLGW